MYRLSFVNFDPLIVSVLYSVSKFMKLLGSYVMLYVQFSVKTY